MTGVTLNRVALTPITRQRCYFGMQAFTTDIIVDQCRHLIRELSNARICKTKVEKSPYTDSLHQYVAFSVQFPKEREPAEVTIEIDSIKPSSLSPPQVYSGTLKHPRLHLIWRTEVADRFRFRDPKNPLLPVKFECVQPQKPGSLAGSHSKIESMALEFFTQVLQQGLNGRAP